MTALATPADISEDELYEIADKIELAMETKPMGHGWTPSELGRKAKVPTHKAHIVLGWMVEHVFVQIDDRGAWSHYYRRH
jgi:hypothetical protein